MSLAERAARTIYDIRFLLVIVIITILIAILYPIKQNRLINNRLLGTANSTESITAATRASQISNIAVYDQIQDCLNPDGKCYKEAERQIAERSRITQEVVIITNACTIFVQRSGLTELDPIEKAIRQCVSGKIAASTKNREGD